MNEIKDEELLITIESRVEDISHMLEKLDFTQSEYKEKVIKMIECVLESAKDLDVIE